jgi:hypothetical protein
MEEVHGFERTYEKPGLRMCLFPVGRSVAGSKVCSLKIMEALD